MTIRDYISKKGLTLRTKYSLLGDQPGNGETVPAILVNDEKSGRNFDLDEFEIYSNEAGDFWVSLNVTKELFRIWHIDIVSMDTEWMISAADYSPAPVIDL